MAILAGLVGECPYAEKPRQPAAGAQEFPIPARPAFLETILGRCPTGSLAGLRSEIEPFLRQGFEPIS